MIVGGFDEAPSGIGWAFGSPGSVPVRGYKELPWFGNNTLRLARYVREWGIQFIKENGIQATYLETIFVRKKGFDQNIYFRQSTVLIAMATAADLAGLDPDEGCYAIEIEDWRNEFFAGGRPTKGMGKDHSTWKDMALAECLNRGWLITQQLKGEPNHNVAEACGIWDYGCKHVDDIYRVRAEVYKRRQQSAIDKRRADAA